MRIGLLGSPQDPHLQSVGAALARLGAEPLMLDTTAFDTARRYAFAETTLSYQGETLDDVNAFWLRNVLSPVPYVYEDDGRYRLYDDWHQDYMENREKHAFWLGFLLALQAQGKVLVNPAELGVDTVKPYQLFRLKQAGLPTPRTLITNDADAVREFMAIVGPVVCKPVYGGAHCERVAGEVLERLPLIASAPAIFQEEIKGADLRVTAVPGQILSAVEIANDGVDYRAGARYGQAGTYAPVELPPQVAAMCFRAMEVSGLGFSGIDLKRTAEGEYVFIELNYSPVFSGIEQITGHPISEGLARYLIACAAGVGGDRPVSASVRPVAAARRGFFQFEGPRPGAV